MQNAYCTEDDRRVIVVFATAHSSSHANNNLSFCCRGLQYLLSSLLIVVFVVAWKLCKGASIITTYTYITQQSTYILEDELVIHHRMQITIRNVIIVVFNNCGIAVDRGLRCREVITSIMVCRHDKYAKMQALSLHIRCNNQQMLEYE